jgi:hypothetical protein
MADTLVCAVCDVTVVVIDGAGADARLTCCGQIMRIGRPGPCSEPRPRGDGEGSSAGYLYVDELGTLGVRCTRSGRGVICCDSAPMTRVPSEHYSARTAYAAGPSRRTDVRV